MMDYLDYSETPVMPLNHQILDKWGVQLLVKREDLNSAAVSGNKWWKIKYNVAEARSQKKNTLLTFGGAYSNHIYATAAAAAALGFRSVGVIRGEQTIPLNPTLAFATSQSMALHYLSRHAYKIKNEAAIIDSLQNEFGDFYLIPERGTNRNAVRGTSEFAQKLVSTWFDFALLAVGTGGTLAGLINGFEGQRRIVGVPVFKGGDYLTPEIESLAENERGQRFDNWSLWTEYHHGGYAKTSPELISFMKAIQSETLPLDHVYTGKLFYAIFREIEKGTFQRGTTLMAIHTGGLQGAQKL